MSLNSVVCIPDARLRSLFSLLLTDTGSLVVACSDVDEVQRVITTRFCQLCVIVQGAMPDTGEFIAAVRKASPDTQILLLANRDDVDSVIPLFAQGLSDALLQPINPKRAVASLQRLLAKDKPAAPSATQSSAPPIPTESGYRAVHLTARSMPMRRVLNELWNARNDPIGVILRGEVGVEFELAAREYQAMGGDSGGYLVVLNHQELDVETLATQLSLDRLNEGVPRTYFVPDVEKLSKEQEKPLLEFLRRARRMRDREKPLRIVFASNECDDEGRTVDSEFLEELQFVIPAVVQLPALRDRREDIEAIVHRVIMDMTAIYPEKRARSIHPSAMQWLAARAWRGNYHELVSAVRTAMMDCANRELSSVHFGRLTESSSPAAGDPEEAAAARVLAAATRAARN
jgi:DNA-binding NtrC family response regulator